MRWPATPPVELKELVRAIVEQVAVAPDQIDVRINRGKLTKMLGASRSSQWPDAPPIILSIKASFRRAGKGKRLFIESAARSEVNAGLVK